MKRGWHHASNLHRHRWQIRVALQADKSDVGARQHSGIGGAVRLMTRLAAFKAHRSVLEGERAALIAVAFEATRLVGGEALQHYWTNTAVRIVAVHAGHVAFGKLVMKRPLELGPLVEVTACA